MKHSIKIMLSSEESNRKFVCGIPAAVKTGCNLSGLVVHGMRN